MVALANNAPAGTASGALPFTLRSERSLVQEVIASAAAAANNIFFISRYFLEFNSQVETDLT